jgi:hypothetical protein
LVLPAGTAYIDLVEREVSVHRNSDWVNGRPLNLGNGIGEDKVRCEQTKRTGTRTCLGHLQKVGLNKTLLAEAKAKGLEPSNLLTARPFDAVRSVAVH